MATTLSLWSWFRERRCPTGSIAARFMKTIWPADINSRMLEFGIGHAIWARVALF